MLDLYFNLHRGRIQSVLRNSKRGTQKNVINYLHETKVLYKFLLLHRSQLNRVYAVEYCVCVYEVFFQHSF